MSRVSRVLAAFVAVAFLGPLVTPGFAQEDKKKNKDEVVTEGDMKAKKSRNFDDVDKDGDGFVTMNEWRSAGLHPGNFTACDRNKDGKLTREEFVNRPK